MRACQFFAGRLFSRGASGSTDLPDKQSPELPVGPQVRYDVDVEQVLHVKYARCHRGYDYGYQCTFGYGRIGEAGAQHDDVGSLLRARCWDLTLANGLCA